MLELEMFLTENVLARAPHRHMVFCIPKILRKYFYWNRECLTDLSRIAWKTLKIFFAGTLNKKGIPGGVQVIETHGEYLNQHPSC